MVAEVKSAQSVENPTQQFIDALPQLITPDRIFHPGSRIYTQMGTLLRGAVSVLEVLQADRLIPTGYKEKLTSERAKELREEFIHKSEKLKFPMDPEVWEKVPELFSNATELRRKEIERDSPQLVDPVKHKISRRIVWLSEKPE